MTSTSQAAYQALRDYLNSLLLPTCPEQPLAAVPMALRPELAAFLRGKTGYEDKTGRPMIYAADLAAWARDLIQGAGLAAPLPLATLDLTALRMATQRQA
ncbi:hypothetical protein [Hymenobacter properus]|uniref:Uncharacterized protein n=1 Tax=Hymenobacter properus TaxID=2791026 RepID=A0A931BQ20_9BACT|nr:hypothetical protein [Hymenobacter properus]MBF9144408.1 hypothetical protein [Hymenobacter properus]MBR7723226.1 hypothetical protein [Microvirga sp. SRT04]